MNYRIVVDIMMVEWSDFPPFLWAGNSVCEPSGVSSKLESQFKQRLGDRWYDYSFVMKMIKLIDRLIPVNETQSVSSLLSV